MLLLLSPRSMRVRIGGRRGLPGDRSRSIGHASLTERAGPSPTRRNRSKQTSRHVDSIPEHARNIVAEHVAAVRHTQHSRIDQTRHGHCPKHPAWFQQKNPAWSRPGFRTRSDGHPVPRLASAMRDVAGDHLYPEGSAWNRRRDGLELYSVAP